MSKLHADLSDKEGQICPNFPIDLYRDNWGSFCRSPAPQPVITIRNTVRCISPVEPTRAITHDADNYLWGSITPSAFLSISTFIPPQEPNPCTNDNKYPSILNWNQPILGSQYARVPFNESTTPAPYSQELSPKPEPVTGPSQPPR